MYIYIYIWGCPINCPDGSFFIFFAGLSDTRKRKILARFFFLFPPSPLYRNDAAAGAAASFPKRILQKTFPYFSLLRVSLVFGNVFNQQLIGRPHIRSFRRGIRISRSQNPQKESRSSFLGKTYPNFFKKSIFYNVFSPY